MRYRSIARRSPFAGTLVPSARATPLRLSSLSLISTPVLAPAEPPGAFVAAIRFAVVLRAFSGFDGRFHTLRQMRGRSSTRSRTALSQRGASPALGTPRKQAQRALQAASSPGRRHCAVAAQSLWPGSSRLAIRGRLPASKSPGASCPGPQSCLTSAPDSAMRNQSSSKRKLLQRRPSSKL